MSKKIQMSCFSKRKLKIHHLQGQIDPLKGKRENFLPTIKKIIKQKGGERKMMMMMPSVIPSQRRIMHSVILMSLFLLITYRRTT